MRAKHIATIDRTVSVDTERGETVSRRISELAEVPYLVLLGEPGMGKTTVFKTAAAGNKIMTVRELIHGGAFDPGKRLYADSFDEYRSDGDHKDKVWVLKDVLEKSGPEGWWLSCRGQDWREMSDLKALSRASNGKRIMVARLLPLGRDESCAIFDAHGIANPEPLVVRVEAIGAHAFLESPLMVELLAKIVLHNGDIPASRFDIYRDAVIAMAQEHNEDYSFDKRATPQAILAAAARVCLTFLVTGAPGIWRSNRPPPRAEDARDWLRAETLGLDSELASNMLDTAIFRGEGSEFFPFHKSIAEFLGGQALAENVAGTDGKAALPVSRALALICAADGGPPSELRGLFAWFAAHLTRLGQEEKAAEVIGRDPYSVLSYGDAAAFSTNLRRVLLDQLDRDDPYPLSSAREQTAFGGLAGDDLIPEMTAILRSSHPGEKFHVVLRALETGRPVTALRPLLRAVSLDPNRPGWQRTRATDAWLNGAANADESRRELFEALDSEPPSASREELRVDLAAALSVSRLSLDELKSVLADYERHHHRHLSGLYVLQRRLTENPRPELFDAPVSSWRPSVDYERTFDLNHLLRRSLAAAISKDPALPAARLHSWLTNVGPSLAGGDEVRRSIGHWLGAFPGRDVEYLKVLLAGDDPAEPEWMVRVRYIQNIGRFPSSAMCRHILERTETSNSLSQSRYVAMAVHMAASAADPDAYWHVYDWLSERPQYAGALGILSRSELEDWRLKEHERQIKANREKEAERQKNVGILKTRLDILAEGRDIPNLIFAAKVYLRGKSPGPDIDKLVRSTDEACTDAIVQGWKRLFRDGMESIDARALGQTHGERKHYRAELVLQAAADLLVHAFEPLEPNACSLTTALSLLHFAYANENEKRRTAVQHFAINRLNLDPDVGSAALVQYWEAMLDTGSDELGALWALTDDDVEKAAVTRALDTLLTGKPGMHATALQQALQAALDLLGRERLLVLAVAAEATTTIGEEQLTIWRIAKFALDPQTNGDAYLTCCRDPQELARADRVWRSKLCSKLMKVEEGKTARADVMIRLLGPRCSPGDRFTDRGGNELADIVAELLNHLTDATDVQARIVLRSLAGNPSLSAWHTDIRHRVAQAVRAARDSGFRHPPAEAVMQALAGQAPINAHDLRATVLEEFELYGKELRASATTPWKKYWGPHQEEPHSENQCRNILTDDLRYRLERYKIAALLPEALRAGDTRADLIILSGAGRNLPLEAKRHNNEELWTAASTQLQTYASDPGADGFGMYLVFWFGVDWKKTPGRPDKTAEPESAEELKRMLEADLPEGLSRRTDVVVLDLSRPDGEPSKRPGRRSKNG